MKNKVQLITYIDRLAAGGVQALITVLDGPLQGAFGGVHLLPFFHPIDGSDAGFDPIDHTQVDPRLGSWDDIRALGESAEITADLIVNHMSSLSPQFQDYSQHGETSASAGLFLTYQRVFPNGAVESDLLRIYRPRPGLPFTTVHLGNGEQKLIWTTFTSQQVDIDVRSPQGAAYIRSILEKFHGSGVRMIRLDAVGFAIKKPGTSCFMIPETFDYIAELTKQAHALDMEVLVEIHSYFKDQIEIARRVDRVYDFALPPLVLHTIFRRNSHALKEWLAVSPRNSITVLDTHDGIGVIDVGADTRDPVGRPGLLPPADIDSLVEEIHRRSEGQSRKATGAAASNLDLYQVNCTFYDAIGRRDNEYLIARAIQFFAPGIPQVYYVGLFAGQNDMDLLARSAVGRDINRHYYTPDELTEALKRPVVRSLLELTQFRNTHPAFDGNFALVPSSETELIMEWRDERDAANFARLDVNLDHMTAKLSCSSPDGAQSWPITVSSANGEKR